MTAVLKACAGCAAGPERSKKRCSSGALWSLSKKKTFRTSQALPCGPGPPWFPVPPPNPSLSLALDDVLLGQGPTHPVPTGQGSAII